jgi:PadR family transcriptional regulator PadR
MRRVDAATQGLVAIAPGSVYPTLRALERAGLVRTWTVIPGRSRGGRARRYHELTVAGGREAEREGTALAGISLAVRAESDVSPAERAAMRARVERVAEVYRFATEMRESLARARPRA